MPVTKTLHLLTGDYPDRLDQLEAALNAAEKDADNGVPRTALEADPAEELLEEFAALKAEAREAGTTVVLTAVGRKVWRELKAKHPARSGDGVDPDDVKRDRNAGVNVETVEDDLVYASLTEPNHGSRAAFDEWADKLSEGEWQTILVTAWGLANGARLGPKDS